MSLFEGRKLVYKNAAQSTLQSTLTAVQTSITVVDGSTFPSPVGGEIATLVLRDDTLGWYEIMNCTARVGNVLTVERGAEGTQARAWPAGTRIVNAITAALWIRLYLGPVAPLIFTSRPYALEDTAGIEGLLPVALRGTVWMPPVEAVNGANLTPLSGTLRQILLSYSLGAPEAVDGALLVPQSGTLVVILRTYNNGAAEATEGALLVPLGGELYGRVITYSNARAEAVNGALLTPLSGTLV